MNCLLLSMPGTPVIYYGDEIGMGDNIHLGDRDGVRTPMQWSPDRNGGFSRADPAALVLPAIMDPLYGYETVNVEAQLRDPHSLLNWMRRMLAVRRQPSRRSAAARCASSIRRTARSWPICASTRARPILCVANVSRAPQAVELDLSEFAGRVPVELSGGSLFPPIGQLTYLLTLPPYGFYWFVLASAERAARLAHAGARADARLHHAGDAQHGSRTRSRSAGRRGARARGPAGLSAEAALVRRQGPDASSPRRSSTCAPLPGGDREVLLAEIEIETDGEHRPLAAAARRSSGTTSRPPRCRASSRWRACGAGARVGLLTDAFALPAFAHQMLAALARRATRSRRRTATIALRADAEAQRDALRRPADAERAAG